MIVLTRYLRLQARWTGCRLGAEQLRIARMCVPLLVAPPVLVAQEQGAPEVHGPEEELIGRVLAEVRRAVRDQGIPRLCDAEDFAGAASWLRLIVADQAKYHHDNHRKLGHAERRLNGATLGLFIVSIVAVFAHFFAEESWRHSLLLFTAAGPAFAAAFHGAETRLGITHRHALSVTVHAQLKRVLAGIDDMIKRPPADPAAAWTALRALAREAADAMGRENTEWHRLLRRYPDTIPA